MPGLMRGGRLVDVRALAADLPRQVAVLVPAAVHELHEPHAALDHPPRQQAVAGESAVDAVIPDAVAVDHVPGLARQVGQFRDRGLHPVCHLVLGDAGADFGVTQ
jgi:hypothetical protein